MARRAGAREEADGIERRLLILSRMRVATFLPAAAAFLLIETSGPGLRPLLLGLGALLLVLFAGFVAAHRRSRRALDRARLRERIAAEGLARLDRAWPALPEVPLGELPEGHPYAGDLDILGPGSLAHLLGRVTTAPGRALLRRALLDPLAPGPASALELITAPEGAPAGRPGPEWDSGRDARAPAVAALAGDPDLLEALQVAGREIPGSPDPGATPAFLRWARGDDPFEGRRWVLPLARVLAVGVSVSAVAWFLGWSPGALPLLGAIGQLGLVRWIAPLAWPRFTSAEGGEGDPLRWAALLRVARRSEAPGELFERIRRSDAEAALLGLRRILDLAAIRHSSLAHFPLAALFAWDVHILARLEHWRERHGAAADRWVLDVAELELIASLAGLAHDHPDWGVAEFAAEGDGAIRGEGVRHPLLPPDQAVANGVELPGAGRLLLVTGSNMSGKSTLLRALGTNQILGLIGAPVAAERLSTRALLPWTSMRVSDSLSRGVSYFLAELHRLKAVVEGARAAPVLYLLDEILQGTNTAERRIAARIVLEHLLRTEAVGAVTTHDLTLVDAPELSPRSDNVHFREEVVEGEKGRRLRFDYRLRPGPATSRNALLLLEVVGLGPESAD